MVATYEELATAIKAGEKVDARALRAAFVATPDFSERMQNISGLEIQAMHLMEEEPLRLGPLGSAIVDQYPGSLVGHHALATFYSYLEREETAAEHREWVSRIRASVDETAEGTFESPLPVISPAEPNAYLIATGRTPVGSTYVPTDESPFLLKVAAKPAEGRIEDVYFDLDAAYAGWLRAAREELLDADLRVVCVESEDGWSWVLQGEVQLPEGVHAEVWPVSVPEASARPLELPLTWILPIARLTAFAAFRLRVPRSGVDAEQLTRKLPVEGMPEGIEVRFEDRF